MYGFCTVSVKFKFTIKFIRREKGFKSEILTEQQCSGENIYKTLPFEFRHSSSPRLKQIKLNDIALTSEQILS